VSGPLAWAGCKRLTAPTHTHTREWTDGLTNGRRSGAQTLLQQWAALELLESKPSNVILQKLLQQEADTWQAVLEEVCGAARSLGQGGACCRAT